MAIPKLKSKVSLKLSVLLFLSLFTFPLSAASIVAMGKVFGSLNVNTGVLLSQAETLLKKICDSGFITKTNEFFGLEIGPESIVEISLLIGLICYYLSDGMKTGFKASKTLVSFVHKRMLPFMTNPFTNEKSFLFTGLLFTIDLIVILFSFYMFFALAFPLSLLGALKKMDFSVTISADEESLPRQKIIKIISSLKEIFKQ